MPDLSCDWLIVGGGPVGTVALAALIARVTPASMFCWADPRFGAMGRLGVYASVPANTRTDRLLKLFRSLPSLDFEAAQARRRANGTRVLSDGDELGTESLQLSIDALLDGSEALRRLPQVTAIHGSVRELHGR